MRFYKMLSDEGKRKKYAWAFPAYGYPTKTISCNQCHRVWNSFAPIFENKLAFPILLTNEHFADMTSCEAMLMANEKVKQIIQSNNIKTVTFSEMPVILQDELSYEQKKELRDKGYNVTKISNIKERYYMIYTEIGAKLHKDSNFEWIEEGEDVCKHCGYGVGYKPKDYFDPYYIELDSWNGDDIFRVEELTGTKICTEKFMSLCKENNVTGILFEEIIAK